MLGAIVGDVLGSTFEFYPMKTKKFELLEKLWRDLWRKRISFRRDKN